MGKVPKRSTQAGASSTPGKLFASGGGMTRSECEKIFQEFDPPIVTGTYCAVSKHRQDHNKAHGQGSCFQGQQSEHFLCNSAFQEKRGVNSSNIPGASGYTEGTAFAYNVYDGQSAGTEHKHLTDKACMYEKSCGNQAPNVKDRLDAAEKWTADSLDNDNLQRKAGDTPRTRVKNPDKKTPKQRDELCKKAAKCLRMFAENQFSKQKISLSLQTRKGLIAKKRKARAKAAKTKRRGQSV